MTKSGTAAGLAIAGLLACGWTCEPTQPGGQYHLPSGWKLNPKRCQMLARSYPHYSWISLIIKDKDRQGWLLTTPHPIPQLQGDRSTMSLLFRRSPMPSPLQPRPPKPKVRPTIGFAFVFRASKPLTLQLRLQESLPTSLLQPSRRDRTTVYQLTFALPKTGRSWRKQRFYYKQFRVVARPKDKRRPDPMKLLQIQFWAWPKTQSRGKNEHRGMVGKDGVPRGIPRVPPLRSSRGMMNYARREKADALRRGKAGYARRMAKSARPRHVSESVTLTMRGPFRILGQRLAWEAPSRRAMDRKRTSTGRGATQRRRAASKLATSRPTSQPAPQASTRPTSHATSRPIAKPKPKGPTQTR